MMRLAEIPERAADRAQGEAQQAGASVGRAIQPAGFAVVPRALGYAKNVGRRNPVPALHGGVADHENPACSFFVQNGPMDYAPSAILVQYDASAADIGCVQRPDGNDVSVVNRWIHAGSMGPEMDRRATAQERFDDFGGLWRGW